MRNNLKMCFCIIILVNLCSAAALSITSMVQYDLVGIMTVEDFGNILIATNVITWLLTALLVFGLYYYIDKDEKEQK